MLHRAIFNDNVWCNIVAQKCRRFLMQHLSPQHVAQLWTDFKYLQRCCNKLIVMLHGIDFSRNNVAVKIVPCNITWRLFSYFVGMHLQICYPDEVWISRCTRHADYNIPQKHHGKYWRASKKREVSRIVPIKNRPKNDQKPTKNW